MPSAAHPFTERIAAALAGRAPTLAERDEPFKEAAVALVLVPRAPDDADLLLIRRATREGDPWSGQIGLPGGRLSPEDASLEDAAMRETFEETGLKVDLTGLLNVYTYPGAPVIVVYKARVIGGSLTTCDENDALEWVAPDRIPWDELAFQSTREALREWVAAQGLMPKG